MLLWLYHQIIVGLPSQSPSSFTSLLNQIASYTFLANGMYLDLQKELDAMFYFFECQDIGVFPIVNK
jgi:hypothetical protein